MECGSGECFEEGPRCDLCVRDGCRVAEQHATRHAYHDVTAGWRSSHSRISAGRCRVDPLPTLVVQAIGGAIPWASSWVAIASCIAGLSLHVDERTIDAWVVCTTRSSSFIWAASNSPRRTGNTQSETNKTINEHDTHLVNIVPCQ